MELLATRLKTDPVLALSVRVPVGGTAAPMTAANADQLKLRVIDPAHMKARLDEVSMPSFMEVIHGALQDAGHSAADLDFLGVLHMKPSAHKAVLEELGLSEEQSVYLADYGHLGQLDPILALELARDAGRIGPGSLIAVAAAGVGYHWGAAVLRWS
jgi:3-oxoacyl-[acyl-carrier-protein] synthase-3